MGKAVMNVSFEEKILAALFFCSTEPNEILAALKPDWNEKVDLSIEEKHSTFNIQHSIVNVFPWKEELSEGIDHQKFCGSFFTQPDLFLRVRPGEMDTVIKKLQIAECGFQIVGNDSIVLPTAVKLEGILDIDKEVVVQDLNSQRTGEFFKSAIRNLLPIAIGTKIHVWDCCAASGGKSIMVYDIDPNIELAVSDIRESILANLKKRFLKAGIKNYKSFVADISSKNYQPQTTNHKLIIADVPCSGSGTWSRTPEQLYFFDEIEIEKYSSLQKSIISNAIPHLTPGGSFFYITCSVFKRENEEVVDFIKEKFNLQLKQMELLKGYEKRADSMFIAVFERSL